MSQGVYTPELRVTFVEKLASEVGDGKEWSMLVTPIQLAELMYRVRDAKWLSGTATTNDGTFESVVTFTSVSPPTEKVEWELQTGDADGAYTRRGYTAVTNDITPDKPMDAFGDNDFSAVTYLTVGGINAEATNPLAYREAIRERSLWANAFPLINPNLSGYYEAGEEIDFFLGDGISIGFASADEFKTGFSFFGTSWTDNFVEPTIYAPFSTFQDLTLLPTVDIVPYYGSMVVVSFGGTVAWVDVNNSGNPIDPLNELYVSVFFGVRNSFDGTSGHYSHASNTALLSTPVSSKLADLKLKLSGGDFITAAIYGWEDYADGSGATATSTDWIFEATEWWPYAKDSPAVPVWNTTTGAKL